jgi:hypothetical protein
MANFEGGDQPYDDEHTWGYLDQRGNPSDAMDYLEKYNPYVNGSNAEEQLANLTGEVAAAGAVHQEYTINPIDLSFADDLPHELDEAAAGQDSAPEIYEAIARAEAERVTSEDGLHHFQLPESLRQLIHEHLDDQIDRTLRPTSE